MHTYKQRPNIFGFLLLQIQIPALQKQVFRFAAKLHHKCARIDKMSQVKVLLLKMHMYRKL